MGKTRLAHEAVRSLGSAHVLRVMSTWPDDEHLDLQEPLFRTSGPEPSGGAAIPARLAMQILRNSSESRRTLVLIDDAHLLDPASAALVLDCAQQSSALLLLTLNNETSTLPALDMLWKDNHVQRIDIGPLDASSMRQLAGEFGDQKISHQTAVHLARLSDGNPLLLRELIRAAGQQGLFIPGPAGWTLSGNIRLTSPILELVDNGLLNLDREMSEALERTVLASPVRLPILERVVRPEVLLQLERDNLVAVTVPLTVEHDATAIVNVRHPLMGYAVKQGLPELRRRAHINTLLSAYPTEGGNRSDLVVTTRWRLELGISVSENEVSEAAHHAATMQDLTTAQYFTEAAWRYYPSARTAKAHSLSLIACGQFDAASALLSEAESRYPDERRVLAAGYCNKFLLEGDLTQAKRFVASMTGESRRVYEGMTAYFQGDIGEALELCAPFIDDAASPHHLEAGTFYLLALLRAGRPQEALNVYDRLRPDAAHQVLHSHDLAHIRALIIAEIGDVNEAVSILSRSYDHAIESRLIRLDVSSGLALSEALLRRGRPRQALDSLRFHPSYLATWPRWQEKARVLSSLATAMLGRTTLTSDLPPLVRDHSAIQNHLAHAWRHYLSGDRKIAAEVLTKAAASAMDAHAYADTVHAVHELARLGLAKCVSPFLDIPVEGPLLQAKLDFARALLHGDMRILRRSAETFTQCGCDLYAAEAYAQLSYLYRDTKQDRAATAAGLRAHQLADRCEGATTPALLLVSATKPLTDREAEIVLLVTQGLTDREIAERLILSIRTVGNHLYRIYRKVGVTNRRALQKQIMSE